MKYQLKTLFNLQPVYSTSSPHNEKALALYRVGAFLRFLSPSEGGGLPEGVSKGRDMEMVQLRNEVMKMVDKQKKRNDIVINSMKGGDVTRACEKLAA